MPEKGQVRIDCRAVMMLVGISWMYSFSRILIFIKSLLIKMFKFPFNWYLVRQKILGHIKQNSTKTALFRSLRNKFQLPSICEYQTLLSEILHQVIKSPFREFNCFLPHNIKWKFHRLEKIYQFKKINFLPNIQQSGRWKAIGTYFNMKTKP